MKTCTICKHEKPVEAFEAMRRQCKPCRAALKKVSRAKWYARNKEHAVLYTKLWREQHPLYRKVVEYTKRADTHRIKARTYRKENRPKINALSRKYQCAKIQRTPAWLSPEDFWLIEEAYEIAALRTQITKLPWEVDHVIPLRGKLVSGLHVPTNLRVILKTENAAKKHHYLPS